MHSFTLDDAGGRICGGNRHFTDSEMSKKLPHNLNDLRLTRASLPMEKQDRLLDTISRSNRLGWATPMVQDLLYFSNHYCHEIPLLLAEHHGIVHALRCLADKLASIPFYS